MMSRKTLILFLVYAIFLILGAVMFMFLEYEVYEDREVKELREWTRLKELALQVKSPEDELLALAMWLPKNCTTVSKFTLDRLIGPGSQVAAVKEVENKCPHLHIEEVNVTVVYPWSFIDSLYFSMTVATTIGYGYTYPTLAAGRVMCMIYAVVGIPLTGILLALTSEFFGELLFELFKAKLDNEKQQSRKVIAFATCIYIAIGFVVFIFLPAVIFMVIEEWSYLDGVYFAFITLTTIGFGDLVTGTNMEGGYLYVYQVGVILWIMVGLGYWVMVANFITKALKSKRLQSSVIRSAEEMKKLMQQMGIKNHDPRFLRQHSKATINFMLQLSNIIAIQGGVENGSVGLDGDDADSSSPPGTSTTSSPPFSPVSSPMGIPGIASLFGPAMNRNNPLGQLIGPLGLNKFFLSQNIRNIDEDENETDETNLQEQQAKGEQGKGDLQICDGTDSKLTSQSNPGYEEEQHDDDDPLAQLPLHSRRVSHESQITLQLEEERV